MTDNKGYNELGFAKVDLTRATRCGRPEVIFCPGKTEAEVAAIAKSIADSGFPVLATRATDLQYAAVHEVLPAANWHERARCITVGVSDPVDAPWPVAVLTAGTSDLAVAEEAAVTLEAFGHQVERISDCGVAGLHRLLDKLELLRSCGVVIVVAGMEGALPSVIAGLLDRPVIAVPTSVGYGVNLGGVSALLGMLTSCASKVTVVNIDNGFGAACAADAIVQLVVREKAAS